MANILVVYYSSYGHIFTMAKAVVEGAESVAETHIYWLPTASAGRLTDRALSRGPMVRANPSRASS